MVSDSKRVAILNAAYKQFIQYGYRKTSMDDIAKSMSISRASLYSYFENKDEIFRCVSMSVHESALAEAKLCLEEKVSHPDLGSKIESALLARHLPFHERAIEAAHGLELHDEYSRLCGDIVTDSFAQFQSMLATTLRSAAREGEINLKPSGISAAGAAELLNLATAGFKRGALDVRTFEKRVKKFVKIFVSGLRVS